MTRLQVELNVGLWKMARLEADFKNFLFKLMQGRLYLNQALAHFAEVQPGCTFCTIMEKRSMKTEGVGEDTDEWAARLRGVRHESVQHLMWECEYTQRVVHRVGSILTRGDKERFRKKEYFIGLSDVGIRVMQMSDLIVHFVKYYLYKCKQRFRIPTANECIFEMGGMLNIMQKGNKWQEEIEDLVEIVSRMMD